MLLWTGVNGSLLDLPHALTNGLLDLMGLDAVCRIDFKYEDDGIATFILSTRPSSFFNLTEDGKLTTSAPWFLTLLIRGSGGRNILQKNVPLRIPEVFQNLLRTGHRFGLQTTSIEVEWLPVHSSV